jgi:glycosyltransferase involved in cell wall biosynthesis
MDDGSTDGTASLVRNEFPGVKLQRFEESKGLIVRRNDAARLAEADIIFSIDDDAAFSTSTIVAQTLVEFDSQRIGAIAIPYTDINRGPEIRQRAPERDRIYITDTYIGTAHAVRRDVFLSVGGYREQLVHQGEERDYCLRMLSRGWVVRLGCADPIHHFESPRRDFRRMDFYGRRNDILFAWHNVPMPYLALHLVATTLNGLRAGLKTGRLFRMLQGMGAGYRDCMRERRERRPVAAAIYHLSRRLKKGGPAALDSMEPLLPALQPPSACGATGLA